MEKPDRGAVRPVNVESAVVVLIALLNDSMGAACDVGIARPAYQRAVDDNFLTHLQLWVTGGR